MMEYNRVELTHLASTLDPSNLDKEGILLVLEQENEYKKILCFKEKWFVLRGNLLFYYSSAQKTGEPAGVLALERAKATKTSSVVDRENCFQLEFEFDDQPLHLSASSSEDCDSWIQAINTSGYEYMKQLLVKLRDQQLTQMGHYYPKLSPTLTATPDDSTLVTGEESFLELTLHCDNLPSNPDGALPNTVVEISSQCPENGNWLCITHTEIEMRSCNPKFLKSIFVNNAHVSPDTPLKAEAKDLEQGTMRRVMGSAIFTITSLMSSPGNTLHLPLSDSGGTVTVIAWKEDDSSAEMSGKGTSIPSTKHSEDRVTGTDSPPIRRHTRDHVRQMSQWFGDLTTRAYRFPTEDGKELKVHEFLGESKLTYYLPQKLLEIWKLEDERLIRILEDLKKSLPKETEKNCQDIIQHLKKLHNVYCERLKYIEGYRGPPFVPSTNMKRSIRDTEFMPTNLHQQRMDVTPQGSKGAYYDTTTVGAFTAFTLRYRQGGLRRILSQFEEQTSPVLQGQPRGKEVRDLMTQVALLEKEITKELESLNEGLEPGCENEFQNGANRFICKMREFIQVCSSEVVQECLGEFSKLNGMTGQDETFKTGRRKSLQYILPKAFHSFKKHRRKFGSMDERKQLHMDPWVSLRSNLDSVLVIFEQGVNQIIEADDNHMWKKDIERLTKSTLAALGNICSAVLRSLGYTMVQEASPNVSLWSTIGLRRNVCFSQGLTALTAGFIAAFSSSINYPKRLEQFASIGILVDFECLLSCFGDEVAMLEDQMTTLEELDRVKFKVCASEDEMPRVVQTCPFVLVEVPLRLQEFEILPLLLKGGAVISIKTAFFNIGINEQATLGERLGETRIQDEINRRGYEVLCSYKEEYLKLYDEPARCGNKETLTELLDLLQQNLAIKKSRNTDILFLSSEICRLMQGIRFTTCKSSRDRTSMATTLEQTQILQREHKLAAKDFMRALECMRTDGVRRANAIKNTGKRHYDFSTMRVMAMPRLFKPPSGCYRPI